MMRAPFLALAPVALLAACGTSVDPDDAIESVRATEQSQLQAIADKDLRGSVRNYRDGAVLVAPGEAPATTGEAIAAVFDELLADPNLKLEIEPGEAWAAESGDLAVTTFTGTMTVTDPDSGEPVTVPIGNQTVWTKTNGKPWMIVSDYNYELAAPEVADAAE